MSYEPIPPNNFFPPFLNTWLAGFWRYTEDSGSWTPEYSSDGTAPSVITYDQQEGLWVRKGLILFAWWRLGTDALTVGTGNLKVTGLPYANGGGFVAEGTLGASAFVGSDSTYNSARPVFCRITSGNSEISFDKADMTTVDATATYLATGANSNRMRGFIAYPIAER